MSRSVNQACNILGSDEALDMAELLNSFLIDITALKTSLDNANAKLDAIGNTSNSTVTQINAAAGTNNASGNTVTLQTQP